MTSLWPFNIQEKTWRSKFLGEGVNMVVRVNQWWMGVHLRLGGNMEVTENSLRWRLTTHYLGLLLRVNWAAERLILNFKVNLLMKVIIISSWVEIRRLPSQYLGLLLLGVNWALEGLILKWLSKWNLLMKGIIISSWVENGRLPRAEAEHLFLE